MPKRILVPLDGSKTALTALPPALALAERDGARIFLATAAHTLPPVTVKDGSGAGRQPAGGWFEEERKRARTYLAELREEIGETSVEIEVRILSGRAVGALSHAAEELEVDLIVMTSHGRGRLERLWIGSVADGLIREGPCPILLWRPGWDQVSGPDAPLPDPDQLPEAAADLASRPAFRKILIPLDGSGLSESILPHVRTLAEPGATGLHLVSVVPPAPRLPSAYLPDEVKREESRREQTEELRRYLESRADTLRSEGFTVDIGIVQDEPPAEGILARRRAVGADLVALSTRGQGGVARLVTGSVADKVIRAGQVPVLVHRPRMEVETR
ncbi:MAG: universal stress protein [Gemmatimonadales bacterium]|nr:MAG: universal stress protein [Gemmatimonadales bacterium]